MELSFLPFLTLLLICHVFLDTCQEKLYVSLGGYVARMKILTESLNVELILLLMENYALLNLLFHIIWKYVISHYSIFH